MKYCARCGKEFEGESNFCPECAAAVQQAPQQPYQAPQQPYQQAPYQQPYQQAPYQQPYQPPMEVDAPNTGFAILGFFFPLIGLILWLMWKDKTPLKAKSCGKGALIGVIVNVGLSIIFTIIGVVIPMIAYGF